LNELRVALSNCTEELEQSRKAVDSKFDFGEFLKDFPYEPVDGQIEWSSIRPYTRNVHSELHKDVMGARKHLYFINYNEVIWSPSGIALGLVVKPTFQYNPKSQGGVWTRLKDEFDVGKQMDVCCSSSESSKTFRYLGTYERVGDQDAMMIASESLKSLGSEKLNHASKCTTLYPDLVSPSQTRMVNNMYKQGVIKLQCFVIRCVAVNQTFTEKLRDKYASSVQRNLSDHNVSRGARKRKREHKSTVHSTKSKKRKH